MDEAAREGKEEAGRLQDRRALSAPCRVPGVTGAVASRTAISPAVVVMCVVCSVDARVAGKAGRSLGGSQELLGEIAGRGRRRRNGQGPGLPGGARSALDGRPIESRAWEVPGVRRIPLCLRRRTVSWCPPGLRLIDGRAMSGLACASSGPARSTRERPAMCSASILGHPPPRSASLRDRDRGMESSMKNYAPRVSSTRGRLQAAWLER